MKRQAKRRTVTGISGNINPSGGLTTQQLFEKHGITWTDEYENDEIDASNDNDLPSEDD